MRYMLLLLGLITISAILGACSMDTTGGFDHGGSTMNGKDIYDPGDIPWPF